MPGAAASSSRQSCGDSSSAVCTFADTQWPEQARESVDSLAKTMAAEMRDDMLAEVKRAKQARLDDLHRKDDMQRPAKCEVDVVRRWQRFSGGKEGTLWYYRELANAFQDLLPGQLAE